MKQGELNKLIDPIIKSAAKSRGWQFSRGFIFQKAGPLFFSLIILGHAKSRNLHHVFQYKWFEFDELFWQIVGLPENSRQPLSFHAAGAWTAPMTEISTANQPIETFVESSIREQIMGIFDETEELRERLLNEVQTLDANRDFIRRTQASNLERFPGSVRTTFTQEVLNAILNNDRTEAIRVCDARIAANDWGGFGWSNETFFTAAKRWILEH